MARLPDELMSGFKLLPLERLLRLVIKLVAGSKAVLGAGALIETSARNSFTRFGV